MSSAEAMEPSHPGSMSVKQGRAEVSSSSKELTGTQPPLRSRLGFGETQRCSDGFECPDKDKMKQPDSSLLKYQNAQAVISVA